MSQWVAENNIRDFKEKIGRETDHEKRQILEKLLARKKKSAASLASRRVSASFGFGLAAFFAPCRNRPRARLRRHAVPSQAFQGF